MKLARHTSHPHNGPWWHVPCYNYAYEPCQNNRTKGCQNPKKHSKTTILVLTRLKPKFNPTNNPPDNNLTLTYQHQGKDGKNLKQRKGEILFDPSITLKTNLAEGFCIFTDPDKISTTPAHWLTAPMRELTVTEEIVLVYTNGSCLNNGKQDAHSSAGIWFGEDHPHNKTIKDLAPNTLTRLENLQQYCMPSNKHQTSHQCKSSQTQDMS